jgi:TM2 domain-containing membrane protein YozV
MQAVLVGVAPASSPGQLPMPPRLGESGMLSRGKRRTVAGLLAILLGGAGLHKFYLGNWGLGLVFLGSLFVLPGLSLVVGAVEGIRLFTLDDTAFDRKYNFQEIKPFDFIW